MNKIMVKEVGQAPRIVEVNDKYYTKCARKYINDYPQKIEIKSGLFMCIDDEGLRKELPINFYLPSNVERYPVEKIVGTVVFIRIKPFDGITEIYDYEVGDLTLQDTLLIMKILSDEYQEPLKNKFVDYGKGYFIVRSL